MALGLAWRRASASWGNKQWPAAEIKAKARQKQGKASKEQGKIGQKERHENGKRAGNNALAVFDSLYYLASRRNLGYALLLGAEAEAEAEAGAEAGAADGGGGIRARGFARLA